MLNKIKTLAEILLLVFAIFAFVRTGQVRGENEWLKNYNQFLHNYADSLTEDIEYQVEMLKDSICTDFKIDKPREYHHYGILDQNGKFIEIDSSAAYELLGIPK